MLPRRESNSLLSMLVLICKGVLFAPTCQASSEEELVSVLQAQKLACTVLKPADKPAAGASRFATNLSTDFLPIMKPQG